MSIVDRAERRAQIIPAIVAMAVYAIASRNGFAYDDVAIVVQNDRIHHWATLLSGLGAPYWYNTGHLYRPLTTFSFGLEWILSNGSPALFHLINILWHAGVSALVARLTLRWWSPTAGLAAGLWFAMHPVHVEAVANIVGRSELVCAAALIGVALVASAARGNGDDKLVQAGNGAGRGAGPESTRLLLVGLLSALAMASKETGLAAPVIAWAAAWTRLNTSGRPRGELRGGAWRMASVSAVAVSVMIAIRYVVLGSLAGDQPHPAFIVSSAGHNGLLLALASLPRALGLVLVPQLPRPDYSPTDAALSHPDVALVVCGVALVGLAIAVIVVHAWRPSPWSFAGVFTVATFAPVSNVVIPTGVVLAERTLYSPSIGVALVFGAGAAALWQAIRGAAGSTRIRQFAAGGGLALIAALAIFEIETSIPIWRDNTTIFAAVRARAPDSYRGYFLEADAERDRKQVAEAQRDYGLAIARFSGDVVLLHHAGLNALAAHDTAASLRWLGHALQVDSAEFLVRTDLAQLYLHQGDTVRARGLLEDGVRLSPDQRGWRHLLASISASPK